MTIEIITAHEADQRIKLRRPLGTDEQGRYPEVAPLPIDAGDPDEDLSQFGAFNAVPALAVFLMAVAALVALVLAATGNIGWLSW